MRFAHGLGLGVVLSLVLSALSLANDATPFPWHTDLDEARELATVEGKPLLITFRCVP